MAKGGIPVVLVDNGTPVVLGNRGTPITIVGSQGGSGAIVSNGDTVVVNNSTHTDVVNGTADIVNGVLVDVHLPATAAIAETGDEYALKKVDGSNFVGDPVTATVTVANGSVTAARLPANETILKDMQASIDVGQYDGSGGFAATVNVANNEPNIQLANATTRIIVNAAPCQVSDSSGKTVGAVFGVDQGALQPIELTASGDAIVSTGQQLTGVAPTGTYTNTVTFTVANGVITGITLS